MSQTPARANNPAMTALVWITAVALPLGLIMVIAGAQLARDSFSGTSPVLTLGIVALVVGAIVGMVALIISALARGRRSS